MTSTGSAVDSNNPTQTNVSNSSNANSHAAANVIETGSLKTLIDSELFAVLAWKSKRRTLKYFTVALIACLLNSVWKVSCTVLLLTALLVLRGPRIALNLFRA